MSTLDFDPIQHPNLILNREELNAIRTKIDTQDWAKEAFAKLIEKAEKCVASNIVIPKLKGQWTHYYACEKAQRRSFYSPHKYHCNISPHNRW